MPSMTGFHALRHLPEEKVTDKISRRVLAGDQEMIVWWSMRAGAHAAAHRHPNEQMFVTNRVGSTEKAARLLGFAATTPLSEGLRSVVEWRARDRGTAAPR